MKILFIGDVVGSGGCEILLKKLPELKKRENIDLTIVNGENSADGNGIIPSSAENIFSAGADVITGGNHTFRRREIYEKLDSDEYMVRPANMPKTLPGAGLTYVDMGHTTVAVINLLGTVYMESADSPFFKADELIAEAKKNGAEIILVDFHAEATSEKRALGFYLDSRVTAVVGTHTHVQTADEQILEGGTAYITDLGMTGTINSVLGIKKEIAIQKMRDKLPVRFQNETGKCRINGCIVEVDRNTKKAVSITRINTE